MKKNLLKQYKTEMQGQEVTVNQFKPKDKKGKSYGRTSATNCPCCGSKLALNELQIWYCTSDKLKYWESEFEKYSVLSNADKAKYILNISSDSQFFDLLEKWKYSKEINRPEEYNCGYTNNLFLPVANTRTIIPDTMVVKKLEKALKRSLTEEELMNEGELYYRHKKFTDKWFKGCKKFVITYLVLPDELSFVPKTTEDV